MVGKRETFLKLPYLQNDKQQDGGSTNVCLKFLLLTIIKSWTGQVKFGTEVNNINFTHYMQNKPSFKLFNYAAILIHSVSLIFSV